MEASEVSPQMQVRGISPINRIKNGLIVKLSIYFEGNVDKASIMGLKITDGFFEVDLALFKGFAKYMKYQQNTYSNYNTPEELYDMRKYKEELINQAANENWDIEELLPQIILQLNELELLTNRIEKHQNQ